MPIYDTLLVIAVVSTSLYAAIVVFLFFGFLWLRPCHNRHQPSVSVIIAARNEVNTIDACLHSMTEQDYPTNLLEIVVVDDRSTDGTGMRVETYTSQYPWIKLVRLKDPPAFPSAKKWALAQGISAASNDILFFTDADCFPPPSWISSLVQCFAEPVGVVVGFSPIHSPSGRVWNLVLGLDSLAAGFVAAGTTGLGTATTCSGRNLAYRRIVYEEVSGFTNIAHSVSGDDDLFLQLVKQRTKWKIACAITSESIVPAIGPANLHAFIHQKKRHLSAGRYYCFWQQIAYGVWHTANVSIWILPILAMTSLPDYLIFWVIKLFIDFVVLFAFAWRCRLTNFLWGFPIWELFFVAYHVFIGPMSLVSNIRWKE
jgi:cellulose synthase/poly-beta-1,6-N-acetylglucosamine synthase-like glycosyltransferase